MKYFENCARDLHSTWILLASNILPYQQHQQNQHWIHLWFLVSCWWVNLSSVYNKNIESAQTDLRLINMIILCFHEVFRPRSSRGGGNLGIILVRVYKPVFWNPPQSYTWSSKKNDVFIYLIEQNAYIFIYCSLIFMYTLFAVCKQSLQINITIFVSELNIWAKIWVFSNRDVRKQDHSYINNEKLGLGA